MPLSSQVSLRRLSLIEISIPQTTPFRSAVGERLERRALFVRWTDEAGISGIGECSCRPEPFFNGEFVAGAVGVLRDHVLPLLPSRATVGGLVGRLSRIRGWNFTVGALLDAVFDLLRRHDLPDPLDEVDLPSALRVPVGVSLGLFASADEAVRCVGSAVDAGYRRVKLKVAPDMCQTPLVAVRREFPDLRLSLDANGSCGGGDEGFLDDLIALGPCNLEQPFHPGRIDLAAALRKRFPELVLCLDESVSDLGGLIAAHRLGALGELNLKPGRVGGQLAVLEILDYCAAHEIPVWIGGMFETGVGRAANLRFAARLPKAKAHDLSPPTSYLAEDVVRHPLRMARDGFLPIHDAPVELDTDALRRLTKRRIDLEPSGGGK